MSTTLDTMLARPPDVCGGLVRTKGHGLHLSLAQVYSALAYYHANRAEIEAELAAADRVYDELKRKSATRDD